MLEEADAIIGHNIIGYDNHAIKLLSGPLSTLEQVRIIQKLYPSWNPKGEIIDTLVIARVAQPDIKSSDFGRFRAGKLPGKLIGSYSLKAWGYRLGEYKGDFGEQENAWETWTPEMSQYCIQDVKVTYKLYERLKLNPLTEECFELEHRVATIIAQQEQNGFLFDYAQAEKLTAELAIRRTELREQLQETFPPFYRKKGREFIPKRDNAKSGYVAGCPMSKIELVDFNPTSRSHISRVLMKNFGWEPQKFTDKSGEPTIDDEILSALPWPEAQLIGEYMLVSKRISQIAEGDKAWLKHFNHDTKRLHGGVNTNGAVTGRMTHFTPNLAQVPSVDSKYGTECRSMFGVPAGYKLVGCDASGLEARCLAHFLQPYDGGEYINTVLNGDKKLGTDVHGKNMKALGLPKPLAKRWFYAWMYGAGDDLLGEIAGGDAALGKKLRAKFLKAMPAIARLIEDIQERARTVGKIRGLDGRTVPCRSPHSALNTLLQGAGALIMKKALVLCDEKLTADSSDYKFVANVHDEFQIEVLEAHAPQAAILARQSIVDAGVYFKFRLPLDGESKIGNNWAETH